MITLPEVTLVCIDCLKYGSAVSAIQKSLKEISPAKIKFLTDINFDVDGIETVVIPRISSKQEYSRFIIKELYKYVDTSYVLIIQWDGYVLDGKAWESEFLQYDYIGAAWVEEDGFNCGNGGFSLRSKRLMEILATDETIVCTHPEDSITCRTYRPYLETAHGIKFALDEVCDKFSFELREPIQSTFGFHSFFHEPYKQTIVLKRSGALGDIISMEPLLKRLHDDGYSVVLDVPNEIFGVFTPHYYPIRHITQFDAQRIPAKYIDLDMAYEIKPQQLHLKSYYESVGISDGELVNSTLIVGANPQKLFKKYAVVHIDERSTTHRNVYGVDWEDVQNYLEEDGYTVIQIGRNFTDECGTWMNAPTTAFLKWIIGCADLFIGMDSGPAHIAVSCGVPSVLFFGSVDPKYIYADLTNIEVVQNECEYAGCWHEQPGTEGQICRINKQLPPCCVTNSDIITEKIFKITTK